MLLITHDLGVVAQNCDKVAVIYSGEIVEYGSVLDVFKKMEHPYTKGLFNSIPHIHSDVRRLSPIPGLMPDPTEVPAGCRFRERCPYADGRCEKEQPELVQIAENHFVRCFRCGRNGGKER